MKVRVDKGAARCQRKSGQGDQICSGFSQAKRRRPGQAACQITAGALLWLKALSKESASSARSTGMNR